MNDEKRRALDVFNKINKPNTLDMTKVCTTKTVVSSLIKRRVRLINSYSNPKAN